MLAGGAWIDAGEPVVLLGDLARQDPLADRVGTAETGRRVRYVTCAALINARRGADDRQLGACWAATPA
jgi:hypothetical protein